MKFFHRKPRSHKIPYPEGSSGGYTTASEGTNENLKTYYLFLGIISIFPLN